MTNGIRPASPKDLPEILAVYEESRAFMAENGNPKQWGLTGYPKEELLAEDIRERRLFVVLREGRIAAVFALFEGEEPTYRTIDGAWPNDKPYLTVHRLGSLSSEHGVGREVLDYAAALCKEKGLGLRADTHEDNKPMRRILEKYGFTYCGVITVADGSERMAYQLESEN